MTSKLVVNTIEADTGISSVSFASSISMSSTSKFHFSDAGIDIGADTNINRPTAGALGFNINSSEKVRIDSNGKVGIATDTGNGLINTRHAGTNQQVLHVRADLGSSNNRSLNLYTPDTDNTQAPFRFQTGNGFLFQCDSEDVFTIAHDRKVGIGTNAPSAKLEVQDRSGGTLIGLSVGTQYGNASFGGYNNYPAIMNSSSQPLIYCDTNNDRTVFFGDTVGFGTTCAFRVNGAERLRIDSSGRVLLGTSSVYNANSYSNNLVIYENGDTGASIIGNNSNSNYASLYLSDTSTASRAYLEAQLGANGNFTIGASGTGPMRFLNNGAERVRIDGNGRLQVNMTSNVTGTAKLEVMGTGDNSYPMYSYGIGVADTQAYNVSNGAGMGIGFSYKHNSGGSYALGCGIRGFKENTTDGDYAGAMAFYTRPNGSGAVERMRISSEGYVTMPNQPSFYGRGYNGHNSGNWKFDAVASSNGEHNQGNHFNNNTGIFTCPVAGHYFIGGGWGYLQSANYCMMGFRYNGNTQINLWEDGRTSQGNLHVSASLGLVIQCNANDTLSFVAHTGYAEPATATVHAWGSIYLVG